MTPQSIIARAESLGLKLIPDGDQIRVRGPHEAILEIAPLVKQAKPELLALLTENDTDIPADLDALIRDAAAYWQFNDDDLRLIRATATKDPDGMRLALSTDPVRQFYRRARA